MLYLYVIIIDVTFIAYTPFITLLDKPPKFISSKERSEVQTDLIRTMQTLIVSGETCQLL